MKFDVPNTVIFVLIYSIIQLYILFNRLLFKHSNMFDLSFINILNFMFGNHMFSAAIFYYFIYLTTNVYFCKYNNALYTLLHYIHYIH